MVNYDELPLFPLHVVLYPEIPLPLHIFEARYRIMVRRCLETNSPFGVVLIQSGEDVGANAVPHLVGTTARISQHETMSDGRLNITVQGETRFRILELKHTQPYLTARVAPFWEHASSSASLQSPFERASRLFRNYLKSLFALSGRSLSVLQLPPDPECLSYTIAYLLQSDLPEKQRLLELTMTHERLEREIVLMSEEMQTQQALKSTWGKAGSGRKAAIQPVDTRALGKLSSRN